MNIVGHIKAIEKAFRVTLPGEPCEHRECPSCVEDRAILDAIIAALEKAEKATKAWEIADSAAVANPDLGDEQYAVALEAHLSSVREVRLFFAGEGNND
jgi:hypothetical protein